MIRLRGARAAAKSGAAEHLVTVPAIDGAVVTQRQRDAGVSHDEAIYTCECGFVFRALVCTSVDCPHCGGAQAW